MLISTEICISFEKASNPCGLRKIQECGFEVFPGLVDGPVVVSVFSPSDATLGTFTIPAIRGGTFFGVISTTDVIGRLKNK